MRTIRTWFGVSALMVVLLWAASSSIHASGQASRTFSILNYVTGWSHDANGYHPTVFLLLENSSAHDLSQKAIRFQGRFIDVNTGEPCVGKAEIRRTMKPGQQFTVTLQGARGYELPFETQYWPIIECKIMCRVGNVGDEGTETLMVARVEPATRTAEEAADFLNRDSGFGKTAAVPAQPAHIKHASHTKHHPAPKAAPPEKPLVASAQSLSTQAAKPTAKPTPKPPSGILTKAVPGLGDDFYDFEQRFGLPRATDARQKDWTWAQYAGSSELRVTAGARQRNSKVDVIVVELPAGAAQNDSQLTQVAKQFAGKLKAQAPGGAAHSVRYLPSARVELTTLSAPGYKVLTFKSPQNQTLPVVMVISRLPEELDKLLPQIASRSKLLEPISVFTDQPVAE